MFTEIITERLALRDLETSDSEQIFQYRSHPEISRFQSWGTQSPDEIRTLIHSLSVIEPGTPGIWYQVGIILLSSRQLVGDCAFHVLESDPRQVEVGVALAPEHQGRGYATEALQALLDYLLTGLGKHRAFGSVDPRNTRSIRLLERLGMRKEAYFVKGLWFKGEWVDDVIFAMLASEWATASQRRVSQRPERLP
jgi:RimJ/RimL family protein N-acetyltransferase